MNSQPKLIGGAPPPLNSTPAGLLTPKKDPAALVPNARSSLKPMSAGSKRPWPMLSSCACDAPVVPLKLSNVIPAQNVDPGMVNKPGPIKPVSNVTPGLNVNGLKVKPTFEG